MSNALLLLATATAPATGAAGPSGGQPQLVADWLMGLMAVGLCLLVVWVVRRIAYPAKFSLVNTPGRPNRLSLLHVVLLFVLLRAGGLGAVMLWSTIYPIYSLKCQLLGAVSLQVVTIPVALLIAARAFPSGLGRGLGLTGRRWLFDVPRGVIGCLIALPVCILVLWATVMVMQMVLADRPELLERLTERHLMLTALDQLRTPWKVGVLLSSVVLAPVAEEIFFRGLLQSMVRQATGRPWVAIVLSAGIFALFHPDYSIPALVVLSIILGYNYERTGRLLPSIVMHALFNGVFVLQELTA